MKNIVFVFSLIACALFISSCAMLGASKTIDKSSLSIENEKFQEEAGLNLIHVKRGLWSMQNTFKNKFIAHYFENLLDNRIEYSIDNSQEEFAKQIISDEKINISINTNIFQTYSGYEKAILLIASTSTLALFQDASYNKLQTKDMFYNFIYSYSNYEPATVPKIIEANWYKQKSISLTDNGIIINQ
jgi:hypothetical protein